MVIKAIATLVHINLRNLLLAKIAKLNLEGAPFLGVSECLHDHA